MHSFKQPYENIYLFPDMSQGLHSHYYGKTLNKKIYNLFVTSKNETMNSLIHESKVRHKGQKAF